MMRNALILLVICVLNVADTQAAPEFLHYHQRLTGDAQESEDFSGINASLAVSGEWLIVGALHATSDGVQAAGAVYVFRKDASGHWHRHQHIPSPEPLQLGAFGHVAMEGDFAVIGNSMDLDDAPFRGVAYIYRFDPESDTWVLDQRLEPSNERGVSSFGRRAVIRDGTIVIGSRTSASAFENGPANLRPARLFVFEPDPVSGEWVESQEIVVEGSRNASALAMDGDLLVVGSHGVSIDDRPAVGKVFVFERDTDGFYHPVATIEPPDPRESRHFGISIALQDGELLIGDRNGGVTDDIGPGQAWLYRAESANDWRLVMRLDPIPVEGNIGGRFGDTVSFFNDMLYVGAPSTIVARDWDAGDSAVIGLLYGFHRSDDGVSAELVQLLTAPDPGESMRSNFGTGLHSDGTHLFVGARGARVGDQHRAGAVYVLEPSGLAPVDLVASAEVVPPVIDAGDEATWIVQVANESDNPAHDVVLHNRIQNAVTFVSASPGCALDDDEVVRCAVGIIDPGAIAEVSLTMRVDQGFGTQGTNTHFATALANEPDVNMIDNTVALAVQVLPPEPEPEPEPVPEPEPERRSGGGGVSLWMLLMLTALAAWRVAGTTSRRDA